MADKNDIHSSLFVLGLKTDKEIFSYEEMNIYKVEETSMTNANASLLNQVTRQLDSYQGEKSHSVEFVYLDFRQINMQRKLLSYFERNIEKNT